VSLSGTGYAPDGEIRRDGRVISRLDAPDVARLLSAAVLCNDAALRSDDGQGWVAVGDPTEAALLTAAAKIGLDQSV
jgi:Ca2+-transporting ATPase